LYLRLEPVSWRQEVRDYPTINVEGRYLAANCKPDDNLRLSNNVKLTDLTVDFCILSGDPEDARGRPLEKGVIGDFRFQESPPSDDYPGMDPFLSGCVFLKPNSYDALWDQVRDGGYATCQITIRLDPVELDGGDWLWDVIPNPIDQNP